MIMKIIDFICIEGLKRLSVVSSLDFKQVKVSIDERGRK